MPKNDETFLSEIKAAVGKQAFPVKLLWYISADIAARTSCDFVEQITSCSHIMGDVVRLQSGGMLIIIYGAKVSDEDLERLLTGIGVTFGVVPKVIV